MDEVFDEKFEWRGADKSGQFEGKFLLAMPNMGSDVFERSIIYICAHSFDGAMGFQVNKSTRMTVSELIKSTELGDQGSLAIKSSSMASNMVRNGGPVDEHRGFVLHSRDYDSDATIPISDSVYLTSNIQILRSIATGEGPRKVAVALGYSGWGPGQLEQEIADNAWLTVDADPEILFDQHHENKYERLLAAMGISSANFIAEAGNA
jgi:putative transcriptional regulator